MIRLKDEEIRQELAKLPDTNLFLPSAYEESSIEWNEFVAKTQFKKFIEWGDEWCPDSPIKRRQCSECWQSLLEEVK